MADKIPVLKKMGVFINVKNHSKDSPIPVMLFKLLKYTRKPEFKQLNIETAN